MARLLTPIETIAVLLPAFVANASPVLLQKKGKPLDRGAVFIDGRPLLGAGKTFEGLLIGLAYGSTIALLFSAIIGSFSIALLGTLSSLGGLAGDILGAFVKRRLGLERGAPAPVLDQLDFYSGALIALYLAGIRLDIVTVLVLALLALILHKTTNMVAYKLRLKDVPW